MRHSPKQPWITHKVLFFQPSSCWELTYGPCRFVSRRHLMWNASAELRTPASSWEPLCFICKVRTFPFTPGGGIWMFQPEEVRGPKFFPFRLTAWLWVVLFPSCNRRASLSKTFTLKWGTAASGFPVYRNVLRAADLKHLHPARSDVSAVSDGQPQKHSGMNSLLWVTLWGTRLLLPLKSETRKYLFTVLTSHWQAKHKIS